MTDSQITLRYRLDEQALRRAEGGTQALIDKINRVKDAARDIPPEASSAGKAIATMGAAADKSLDKAAASAKQLRRELKAVDDQAKRTQVRGGGNARGAAKDVSGIVQKVQGGNIGGAISQLFSSTALLNTGFASLVAPMAAIGASAAIAGPAIGLTALALDKYNKIIAAQNEIVSQGLTRLEAYYQAIQDGTTNTIQAQIRELEKDKSSADRALADVQRARKAARDAEIAGQGEIAAGILDTVAKLTGAFGDLDAFEEKQKAKSASLAAQLAGLTDALNSAEVKTNDLAQAERDRIKVQEEYEKSVIELGVRNTIAQAEKFGSVQRQINELQGQSSQSLEERRRALLQERDILKGQIDILRSNGDASEELNRRLDALYNQLDEVDIVVRRLNKGLIPYAKGVEKVADAVESAQGKIVSFVNQLLEAGDKAAGGLRDAAEGVETFIDKAKDIADAVKDAGEERLRAETDAAEDLQRLAGDYAERRLSIEEAYGEALIDAAQRATDAATDALRDLQREGDEALLDARRTGAAAERRLADDVVKAQIDAQQQEAVSLESHLRRLKQIRDSSQEDEFNARLSRDFLSLFLIRRRKNKEIEDEQGQFRDEQRARARNLQQRVADLQRGAAIEQRERAIQLQQRLEDNQRTYALELEQANLARARDIADAEAARDRDLQLAQRKYNLEVEARRQALKAEITLISQALGQRLSAEAVTQSAIIDGAVKTANTVVAIFNGVLGGLRQPSSRSGSGGGSGGGMKLAQGGFMGAGDVALVNEYGGESYTSGGRTAYFPPGMGIFQAAKAGYVNPGPVRGGATINAPITINGAGDPQAVGREVGRQLHAVIRMAFPEVR